MPIYVRDIKLDLRESDDMLVEIIEAKPLPEAAWE